MHAKFSFHLRCRIISLILAGIMLLGGCGKNPDKPAGNSTHTPPAMPATAPQPSPAATGSMISNTPVNGSEALPPNHPPLPPANPVHPAGTVGMNEDINQQLAAQHPKPAGKKKLTVLVPDNVKGMWTAANIAVESHGSEKKIRIGIGDKVTLDKNLQLHLLHYLPAYTSDFQAVTNSSSEEINPAIQIQAISGGKVIAEGWVFQNLPEFNSFKSEQVKVRLISGERGQKK